MKITKKLLREIIEQEIKSILSEDNTFYPSGPHYRSLVNTLTKIRDEDLALLKDSRTHNSANIKTVHDSIYNKLTTVIDDWKRARAGTRQQQGRDHGFVRSGYASDMDDAESKEKARRTSNR